MTKKKILSLLLALVMVLDMLPRFALPVVAEDQPEQDIVIEESTDFEDEGYITGMVRLSCDENSAQATLEQGNKIYIFTTLDSSLGEQVTYMWQMMTPDGGWATISGYVLPYAAISDALLASATLEDGAARLRCVVGAGEQKYVSQALVISRTGRVTQPEPEIQPEIGTETVEQMNVFSGRVTEEDTVQNTEDTQQPSTDEGQTENDEDKTENDEGSSSGATNAFQIVISYTYRHKDLAPSLLALNGTAAANTFTVSLPAGGYYTGTVATPLEVGYLPYVKADQASYVTGYDATSTLQTITYDGVDYVLANSIEFKNQSDQIAVNVYYIPQPVTYRVKIYEQNLYDDEYTLAETITRTGIANAAVGEGLDDDRLGFTPLYYDPNLPIAEDGSFAVDIYYDRNYYLVNFDLNANGEAYGAPNHFVRYKTPVTLATPTRPGYSFVEWTLEQVKDEKGEQKTTDLYKNPAEGGYLIKSTEHNLTYKAKWSVGSTSYTIIYWLENAENYNFTLDSFKVVENVRPGEVITADEVKDTLSIEDASSFVFNPTLSDVSVTVAADGTTAFNAYYLRKYYTLTYQNSSKTSDCLAPVHTCTTECPTGDCTLEAHSHTMECTTGNAICGKTEHTHVDACCNIKVHEHSTMTEENPTGCCTIAYHVHSGGVVQDCVKPVHEMHHATCYSLNALQEATDQNLTNTERKARDELKKRVTGLNNGYVYRIRYNSSNGTIYNFLYVHDQWFYLGTGSGDGAYNGVSAPGITDPAKSRNATTAAAATAICGMEVHTHGDGNCACNTPVHDHTSGCTCPYTRHVHGEGDCNYVECGQEAHKHTVSCYNYNCGKKAHTHTAGCVRACQLQHTHSSTCQNASNNDFMTVKCKYASDISWVWDIVDGTFTDGQRWEDINDTYFKEVLVYVPFMPPANITFKVNVRSGTPEIYTMNYYLESLTTGTYTLNQSVKANYSYLTKAEDFFDIVGFTQEYSNPTFESNGQLDTNGGTVDLYYSRNEYPLEFVSLGASLSAFTQMLKYQQPIDASYEVAGEDLPYPSNEEPGAIQFAGWYTTPTCADGTEFVFDGSTIMPVGGLVLYAKWVPCTYTLTVYSNSDKDAILVNPLTVPFGTMVQEPSYQNDLRFVSMGKVLTEFTQNLMLHAPIKSEHKPDSTRITPPANNAVFAGWYTTPDCAGTSEFKFDGSATIPAGGLVLYAKWTVNGDMLENPSDFEREERLIFAGWYYVEGGQEKRFDFNTMSVKQDLEIYAKWTSRIPVPYRVCYFYRSCKMEEHTHDESCKEIIPGGTTDTLVCGKEEHTHTGDYLVQIAEETTGYSLAGLTKTFYAKVGSDLYDQYDKGYYPDMRVHSMTMSSEPEENVYYFTYTVPKTIIYTVTHQFTQNAATPIEGETATDVFTSILENPVLTYTITHEISGEAVVNSAASVLVSFREGVTKEAIGRAAQQQLKSAGSTKVLNDGDIERLWTAVKGLSPNYYLQDLVLTTASPNNAVFLWSDSGDNVMYQTIYYVESADGTEYTVHSTGRKGAKNGTTVQAEKITIDYYTLDEDISIMEGEVVSPGGKESGDSWQQGLVLKLYYKRKLYDYTVVYQTQTGQPLGGENASQKLKARWGTIVRVADVEKDISGYVLVNGDEEVEITTNNSQIIICKYQGLEVNYVYQVDPMGANAYFEHYTDKVAIGANRPQANRLTLSEHAGHILQRWTYDIGDGQRQPVPGEWIGSDDKMTVQPAAPGVDWAGKTIYIYAELIPTTRHFRVEGFTTTANDPQVFVFNLKGTEEATNHIDLTFFILDNGHLDIEQLPYGQYTLTTLSWAWRYGHPQSVRIGEGSPLDATSGSVTLNLNTTDEVVITYSSDNKKTQWLSDDVAGVIPTTPAQTPGQS